MTETRNATLADLAEALRDQQSRKLDVVAPATAITSRGGVLHIRDTEPVLDENGVTLTAGAYRPTAVADEGIAEKLGIPLAYVRRIRAERPDLYDANVNGLLHGRTIRRAAGEEILAPADRRSFLVRCFKADSVDGIEREGIARALLSDSYGIMDNFDVLTAALDGIKDAGVTVNVEGCDLTDRRMYVRISAPEVQAMAPELLAGYRSPYSGNSGSENPTVFAGFVLSNSETGGGAFSITPRLIVQVCTNGLTMTKDAMRTVHVGSKMDAGVIRWSADTEKKNLDLVTAKARDAVATFLDRRYLTAAVTELTELAGHPVSKPTDTVTIVGKKLGFSQAHTEGILEHFIMGGQLTAGGVMQAITSFAQTVTDADAASELETRAVSAMSLAAHA